MEHPNCNILTLILKSLDTYLHLSQRRENRRQQTNNASHEVRLGFEDIIKNLKSGDWNLVANNLREKIINIVHSIENLQNLDKRRFGKFSASLKALCTRLMDDMDKLDGPIDKDKYLSEFKQLQDEFDSNQSKIEDNSSSVRKKLPLIGYLILLNHFVTFPFVIIQSPKLIGLIDPFNQCLPSSDRQSDDTVLNHRLIDSLNNAKPYLHNELFQSTSNQQNANTSVTAVNLSKSISDRIKKLKSQPNNPNTSRNSLSIFESSISLVNILANNETIEAEVTKQKYFNHENNKPIIYTIAVLVPITNGFSDLVTQHSNDKSPFSWSLGVLRGIDIAQKAMLSQIDSGNKVLLKALIVNDNNRVNSDQDKVLSLSIAQRKDIVGLIGHNQYESIDNFTDCFQKENLPVITTSLPANEILNQHIYSLLPPMPGVASGLVNAIQKQRKNAGERFSTYPTLFIYYNPADLASQELSNQICDQAKDKSWPDCERIDITQKKNPAYVVNENMELVIAFNPNIGNLNDNSKQIKDIVSHFANEIMLTERKGWIFFGPDVLDESLENSLKLSLCSIFKPKESCSQAEKARIKLSELSEDQSFDLLRIAPRDWRSDVNINKNKDKHPFYDLKINPYGHHLNWQVYNSYNAMMTFRALIKRRVAGNSVSSTRSTLVDMFSGKRSKDIGSNSIGLTVPDNLSLTFPYQDRSSTDLCLVSLIRNQNQNGGHFCDSY